MKLLALGDVYSVKEFGGATRHQLGICSALASRGHEIAMLLPCKISEEPDLKAMFPDIRFILYDVEYGTPQHMPMMLLNSAREFQKTIARERFDIIQLSQPMSSFGPSFSFSRTGSRVVYNFQSPWAEEFRVKRGGKKGPFWTARIMAEASILRKCDAIMTLSEYMKNECLREHPYLKGKNIRVIPGAIDVSRFSEIPDRSVARRRVNCPEGRKILFTARGLKPRSGVGLLIDAMPEIVRRHPDAFLMIGGSGPIKAELESKVAEYSLNDHVRFEGFILDELLPSYYQAADIFVLPTLALEGFGLVTAEALASGTPVVATPVGATPELLRALDPELMAREASPAAIAEAVCRWLADFPALDVVRRKCREHAVSNYSWESVTHRVESFYDDLTGRG